MRQLKVLLVDLTQYGSAEVAALMRRHCELTEIADVESLDVTILAAAPQVLCFEFDYPDMPRLALLRKARRDHRSLPVLMLTEQHSEALAVWALRSRIWDYFVKPLSREQLLRCFDGLRQVLDRAAGGERQPIMLPSPPIPLEARFTGQVAELRTLHSAVDFVLNHLHEDIAQSTVATRCHLSSSQFSRTFKQVYGITFRKFLIKARLEAAARLLLNPSASVAEVCWAVGFHDHSYFSRMFRRQLGVRPSDYRANWLEQKLERVPDTLVG